MDSSPAARLLLIEPQPEPEIEFKNVRLDPDIDCTPVAGAGNKLGEYELLLILGNDCLSTKDLLSFRLVSKLWSDVATTLLLRKDACFLPLDIQTLNLAPHKFGDENLPLKELTKTSSRLPASNLHIHSGDFLSVPDYTDYPDLLLFFKLHGNGIKTICLHGCFSLATLLDIFCIYAPKLECLDLSGGKLLPPETKYLHLERKHILKWTAEVLPFKCLILGPCFDIESTETKHCLKLLLSYPSNLRAIEGVKLSSLPSVLKEEKGFLVRSFEYNTFSNNFAIFGPLMEQFAAVNPKLSKLTLDLTHAEMYFANLTSINRIIEASKGTLNELDLTINPQDFRRQLKIPPMKYLKCVSLASPTGGEIHLLDNQNDADDAGDLCLFEFEVSVGAGAEEYFPCLLKVTFKNQDLSSNAAENLLLFFEFKFAEKSTADDGLTKKGGFLNVDILEIVDSKWPDIFNAKLIGEMFPHVRRLKIGWKKMEAARANSLWVICPLLEFIEIYDISKNYMDDNSTSIVDAFFTGFSVGICERLLADMTSTSREIPDFVDSPEGLRFLRTAPSVVDLQYLKELKLKYSELAYDFASDVTGVYAFSKMPNAKFIISYDSVEFKEQEGGEDYADEETCFGSIRPYVQIICEK